MAGVLCGAHLSLQASCRPLPSRGLAAGRSVTHRGVQGAAAPLASGQSRRCFRTGHEGKLRHSCGRPERRGRRSLAAKAAVAAEPSGYNLTDPSERERLAAEFGFEKIGAPVPEGVTLKQVIDSLPAEVFEINEGKAWAQVVLTFAAVAVGIAAIAAAPWYLLPFAWAYTGTASTGLFVIGHDCAHKSFSKNKLLEDIVGSFCMMFLIYPYEPWRFKHDRHHAKTNMLIEDTAWHPVMKEDWEAWPAWRKTIMTFALGPLRPWASIGHWLMWHFDLSKYRESEKPRVMISLAVVFGFMLTAFPAMFATIGVLGWAKFWLVPWLGYHFWMSTFTMVHHTAPHIPFNHAEKWDSAAAQLGGTVHCDYPGWVEKLCHDISVHIPHHVSQRIPSYNLRMAHDSIKQNWGEYVNLASWNWRLMKTILAECHFFDPTKNYLPFDKDEPTEALPLAAIRRIPG